MWNFGNHPLSADFSKSGRPLYVVDFKKVFQATMEDDEKFRRFHSCRSGRRCVNTVINREQVIKEVARREGIPLSTIQSFYQTLENYIFEVLSCAASDENVELKLFHGISIDCSYQKGKEMIHPESGKLFKTDAKIWAKPKITRYYNRKLNGYFDS